MDHEIVNQVMFLKVKGQKLHLGLIFISEKSCNSFVLPKSLN